VDNENVKIKDFLSDTWRSWAGIVS